MKDIVERLRAYPAGEGDTLACDYVCRMMEEAATEIEAARLLFTVSSRHGITNFPPPAPPPIVILGDNGAVELLRIDSDGTVTGTVENAGEAARVFVEALRGILSPPSFQSRVEPWFRACFPPSVCDDKIERADRFIEEALELVQSGGYSRERAHALVDYVFSRPAGVPYQEVGGAMVTLAAYCIAHGHDMHEAGEVELVRISQPDVMQKIRAKQAAKPVGSALPVAYSGAPVTLNTGQISTYGAIDQGYEPTGEAQ